MKKNTTVDKEIEKIINTFGLYETLAGFCKECERRGMYGLQKKLVKVYDWLVD